MIAFLFLSYQVFHLIQQLVDFVAVGKSNVRLAQQATDPPLQFILVYVHHDHESDQIVQKCREQPILLVFQPLPLRFAQGFVPGQARPS